MLDLMLAEHKNWGPKNVGSDLTLSDQIAGVENARHDNGGPMCSDKINARRDITLNTGMMCFS